MCLIQSLSPIKFISSGRSYQTIILPIPFSFLDVLFKITFIPVAVVFVPLCVTYLSCLYNGNGQS